MSNISIEYYKKNWISKDYHLHIDEAKPEKIKGWLVNKTRRNYSIAIISNDSTVNVSNKIHRPNLHNLFPSIKDVNQSGFEFNIEDIGNSVDIVLHYKKKVINVLSFQKIQKLLYVHIAKTAGSTVNDFLTSIFSDNHSLIHAESKTDWQEQVINNDIRFISGHIPYRRFISCHQIKDDFQKAITFREPYSHIVSHLSWVRALALPQNKQRFDSHPKYIQNLSLKLSRCDFTNPQSIQKMVSSLHGPEFLLFDNTQTRYIRTRIGKPKVDNNDVIDSISNLNEFDFIGHDGNINDFLTRITRSFYSHEKYNSQRSNVHKENFGLDINNDEVKKALYPLVQHDLTLYEKVIKENIEIR